MCGMKVKLGFIVKYRREAEKRTGAIVVVLRNCDRCRA
jgi:hypothetical protein